MSKPFIPDALLEECKRHPDFCSTCAWHLTYGHAPDCTATTEDQLSDLLTAMQGPEVFRRHVDARLTDAMRAVIRQVNDEEDDILLFGTMGRD